jgi:sulfite exporter TauE/SafE
MTPWWLILLGGVLGSSHCIGMCGGFAAIIGLNSGTLAGNLRAQLVYSAGRLMSYVTLGAVAGFAGKSLVAAIPGIANIPAILCLAAGLLLLREGLSATGVWPRRITGISTGGCLFGSLFSTILRTPGARNTFVAGIVTGLLPCGLVYAFVSLAASTSDLLQGAGTMLAFGAGTVPIMVLAGCGSSLLTWPARQRLWKAAAWSVVLTGLLTIGRGAVFLQAAAERKPVSEACPFCSGAATRNVDSMETRDDR